ncbi:ethanolamine utilization protein EutN [Thermotomaculum hydrothermale]|uniref:Ethanolamine utilization protein EutN n=1 Tax=Thermotomaculum hydrothermale TaxID=981385 RepID=A0A7R6PEW0_9BACT|nr:EutN/CcmL family microcompartment protein [Thermotomaculum hydrothermale]BBB32433.1 ethanolamine utilization protein EutN [Thermotomaculum hydrothermale]
MKIGIVSRQIISTEKNKRLEGYPLYVLDIVDLNGEKTGEEVVAFDTVGVGIGEKVIVTIEGDAAVQLIKYHDAPVDAVIVAKIDHIDEID